MKKSILHLEMATVPFFLNTAVLMFKAKIFDVIKAFSIERPSIRVPTVMTQFLDFGLDKYLNRKTHVKYQNCMYNDMS